MFFRFRKHTFKWEWSETQAAWLMSWKGCQELHEWTHAGFSFIRAMPRHQDTEHRDRASLLSCRCRVLAMFDGREWSQNGVFVYRFQSIPTCPCTNCLACPLSKEAIEIIWCVGLQLMCEGSVSCKLRSPRMFCMLFISSGPRVNGFRIIQDSCRFRLGPPGFFGFPIVCRLRCSVTFVHLGIGLRGCPASCRRASSNIGVTGFICNAHFL